MNPTTKTLAAGGLSGAIVVIIITELNRHGIVIDGNEAAALGTVIATFLHYAARWLPADPTPPSGESS